MTGRPAPQSVVLLDPRLLRFTETAGSEPDLHGQVDSLVSWLRLAREPNYPFRVVIGEDTLTALANDGCFPAHNSIRQALVDSGLDQVFSASDIAREVNHFLGLEAHLECHLETQYCDHDGFSCTPSSLEEELHKPDAICSNLQDLLVILAFNSQMIDWVSKVFRVSLVRHPDAEGPSTPVDVQAVLHDTDPPAAEDADYPLEAVATLQAIRAPLALALSLDPLYLWQRAADAKSLRLAIDCSVLRAVYEDLTEKREDGGEAADEPSSPTGGLWGLVKPPSLSKEIRDYCVGSEFLSSLSNWEGQGKHAETILRLCTSLITRTREFADHEYLSSGGGKRKSSAPRKRKADQAIARRVHVTKKGVGLRLHVWERPNGGLEFANVGPKGELKIAIGKPKEAT